jgi:hypothetical protein
LLEKSFWEVSFHPFTDGIGDLLQVWQSLNSSEGHRVSNLILRHGTMMRERRVR